MNSSRSGPRGSSPWPGSPGWPARLARTLPGGWKHYWITATVLTLLTTSALIQIQFYPPAHTGPRLVMTAGAMFCGILGAIANTILYCTHILPGITHVNVFNSAIPWIQTAISAAGLLAFHAWSRSVLPETARSRSA